MIHDQIKNNIKYKEINFKTISVLRKCFRTSRLWLQISQVYIATSIILESFGNSLISETLGS